VELLNKLNMVDMSRLRAEDLERSQDMNRVRRVYRSHAGMSNRCRPQSAKSAVRLSGSARRPLKSAEFDRLKNPRALVRPKSAGPTIGNSQSAPDVGWTVAGKLHIPNNAAGFIKSIADTSVYDNKSGEKLHKAFEALQFKSDMSFPWQLEQRAIEEAEETAVRLGARWPAVHSPRVTDYLAGHSGAARGADQNIRPPAAARDGDRQARRENAAACPGLQEPRQGLPPAAF
jgi:hypothetical protein